LGKSAACVLGPRIKGGDVIGRPPWWFWAAIALTLVLCACNAVASSSTPFNFEYSARFSDVYLMRVRDQSEGVVCYVARSDFGGDRAASVSCVREVKP